MKKFRVTADVKWSVSLDFDIEAETLDDAKRYADAFVLDRGVDALTAGQASEEVDDLEVEEIEEAKNVNL